MKNTTPQQNPSDSSHPDLSGILDTNIVEKLFIPHTAAVNAINRIDRCYLASQKSLEPLCLLVVGESRAGKTRVFEYIVNQHPPYRIDEGLVVPILYISTPASPSAKGLAEELLTALGDPFPDKGTETNMTSRLIKLLKHAQVSMIILDEFQHFYDKSSHKVMHHVADWLKRLIDRSKVSIVVGGLPTCQAVLNQNEQLAGRFMGQIRMPRFDWSDDDSREEFRAILNAFQQSLDGFEWPDLSSPEMAFRFFCATGGLMGYLVKILRQTVQNAIFDNKFVIDLKALKAAYEESLFADYSNLLTPAFDGEFSSKPNANLLASAKLVGTKNVEIPASRRSARPKQKQVTVGEALRGY